MSKISNIITIAILAICFLQTAQPKKMKKDGGVVAAIKKIKGLSMMKAKQAVGETASTSPVVNEPERADEVEYMTRPAVAIKPEVVTPEENVQTEVNTTETATTRPAVVTPEVDNTQTATATKPATVNRPTASTVNEETPAVNNDCEEQEPDENVEPDNQPKPDNNSSTDVNGNEINEGGEGQSDNFDIPFLKKKEGCSPGK